MTNNKQQTAVDILCGKLAMKLGIPQAITFYIDHAEEIAEAKAMHNEEIEQSYQDGKDAATIESIASISTIRENSYQKGYTDGYMKALKTTNTQ